MNPNSLEPERFALRANFLEAMAPEPEEIEAMSLEQVSQGLATLRERIEDLVRCFVGRAVWSNRVPPKEQTTACPPVAENEFVTKWSSAAAWFKPTLHKPSQALTEFIVRPYGPVKKRMNVQSTAKLALGGVCYRFLTHKRNTRVFFESGSTIALAVLAMTNRWRLEKCAVGNLDVETNNTLVHGTFCGLTEIPPRVLYGNRSLNQKYAGFFPLSEDEIRAAIEGDDRSLRRVRQAWKNLLRTAGTFDRLFMAASRFNFFFGPFVGSMDNALLKAAFFACGRRIALLIDGSKLLMNEQLMREWGNYLCIQVLGPGVDFRNARVLTQIFPDRQTRDEQVGVSWSAAQRNPYQRLHLDGWKINQCSGCPNTEAYKTPASWASCIENVLRRKDGELCVYVSEPEQDAEDRRFEQILDAAIDEGNATFREANSPVRIAAPIASTVRVDPETYLLLPDTATDGKKFQVWECRLMLAEQDRVVCETQSNTVNRGAQSDSTMSTK